jgi:Arc/MetJ-type ribon-helix-helix transcriptional regulator
MNSVSVSKSPTVSSCGVSSRFAAGTGGEPRLRADDPFDAGRTFCHTKPVVQKIAVTLDRKTVADLDRWVKEGKYPNRSRALQSAVSLLTERERRTRLARELAKLDPLEEKRLADEGLSDAWPEY